ncbi:uncharacterized protein [Primulina eburnea]|uniref:uncharacterized protein n=1 Tax=Primulina eburnea TaxID=1245227 RepID=UPI003C6C9514
MTGGAAVTIETHEITPSWEEKECMLRSHSPDLLIFDPEIERTARRLRKARREEIKAMADNRENDRQMPPEAIPIRDHFRPVINTHYSGIARGNINANNFELKPEELATKFLAKYFPPAKSAQLKIEISTFRQTELEQLYEAWERYKELLRKCPNHGFEDWVQIELFYNGLNGQTRTTVDAAAGGTIFAKSPAQAYDLLEQMTINSYQWPSERSGVKRTAGVYAVDPITSLTAQVSALTTQIAAMNKAGQSTSDVALVTAEESPIPEENVLNPPSGFNTSNGEGKPSFEDLVGTFVVESGKRMSRTESRLDNLETHMASIGATLKILESQVGQITNALTSQPSGVVQKTADPNLREVNAIFMQHEEIGMLGSEEKEVELTQVPNEKPTPSKRTRDLKNLHSNIQSTEKEEVAITGGENKGMQGSLPQKLQDPGEFVIPCEIRGQLVEKAICDSGASVNVMPSFLYEKLGLSVIKPTGLSLQMADKSIRTPLGVVEDVELKIDKIRLLADFVVLDMGNSQNVRAILGRPFLATAGAIIDVKRRKMTMEVEGQLVEIKASKIAYNPP